MSKDSQKESKKHCEDTDSLSSISPSYYEEIILGAATQKPPLTQIQTKLCGIKRNTTETSPTTSPTTSKRAKCSTQITSALQIAILPLKSDSVEKLEEKKPEI
jgi:hypothetical protein